MSALQVYKQKVKHLLYEHQNNINILKADGELSMKLAADEASKVEGELQKDKRALKLELKEQVGRSRNATYVQQGVTLWACSQSCRSGAASELALQERVWTRVSMPVQVDVGERLLRPPVCDNGAERQL